MTLTIHTPDLPTDLGKYLNDVERLILIRALQRHNLNRTKAGRSLGLSLRQIRYRMEKLGLRITDALPGAEYAYCAQVDQFGQPETSGIGGQPVDRTRIVVEDTITRW